MNRRSFLKRGAAVAGASVAGGLFEAAAQRAAAVPKNRSNLQSVGEESRSEPREATEDTLFQDDFSSLPAGRLTQPVEQLNRAIQEYHYLANRGVPLGPWANALCYFPMKLRMFWGATPLTSAAVTPPQIVALTRNADPLDLSTVDLDAGESSDGGVLFRDAGSHWIFNLKTSGSSGTYVIKIETPDGRRYNAAFVLR